MWQMVIDEVVQGVPVTRERAPQSRGHDRGRTSAEIRLGTRAKGEQTTGQATGGQCTKKAR